MAVSERALLTIIGSALGCKTSGNAVGRQSEAATARVNPVVERAAIKLAGLYHMRRLASFERS
jgi:hypothetical protein